MEVDKQDMVVQIISGFRGSGKTTFLNQCIEQVKGKTAVIQNDFGAQAVDRENAEGSLIYEEIGEGCICCGMALEFEEKMRRIAMEDCPDRIFIEASIKILLSFGKSLFAKSVSNFSIVPNVPKNGLEAPEPIKKFK